MILREMPDLPPRPETTHNAAFRRNFYRRWGRENCVVSGRARYAEYSTFKQTLSIKYVEGGSEDYFVDRRRVRVSDTTYLILNENREYGSVLRSGGETFSLSIFFRPGLAQEVAHARRQNADGALEGSGEIGHTPVEFSEALQPHDKLITPVLRYIRRHVALGVDDPDWYEEQFQFLADRMLQAGEQAAALPARIDCVRAATRRELHRRIDWATDFIHSNLQENISLADMARAARLSRYHFVRTFQQLHGMTPFAYLREQRAKRAMALIESTQLDLVEIAVLTGFNSRSVLARSLQRVTGRTGQQLRRRARREAGAAIEN